MPKIKQGTLKAHRDEMPGPGKKHPTVVTCESDSPASLKKANPQGINPAILLLDLVAGGTTSPRHDEEPSKHAQVTVRQDGGDVTVDVLVTH